MSCGSDSSDGPAENTGAGGAGGSGTELSYPDTLTTEEKSVISSLTSESLSDCLKSLYKIEEILGRHTSEAGVTAYSYMLSQIAVTISDAGLKTVSAAEREADPAEKLSKAGKASFTLGEKKENLSESGNDYLNYDVYVASYDDAKGAVEKYDSFYDGDYSKAYEDYCTAFDACSEAETAYGALSGNLSRPEYDKVLSLAKNAVSDFKDNFILDKTYKLEDIKTNVAAAKSEQASLEFSLVQAADSLDSARTRLGLAGNELVTAGARLSYLKDDADWCLEKLSGLELIEGSGGPVYTGPLTARISEATLKALADRAFNNDDDIEAYVRGYYYNSFCIELYDSEDRFVEDFSNGFNVAFAEGSGESERKVTVTFYWGSTEYSVSFTASMYADPEISLGLSDSEWRELFESTNWRKCRKVSFTIPEGAEEVDLMTLVSRRNDVEVKFDSYYYEDSNRVTRSVEWPKKVPDSVKCFSLDMTRIPETNLGHYYNEDIRAKDNVVLMESMVDPASVLADVPVGGKGAKEVIPGVEIVYYKLYENSNYSTGSRMQSINFTDANKKGKVTMPANYNLTGTYKGGIEGNVEFTNLASTTMSGEVRGFESISAIYSTFVKDIDNSKLPTIKDLGYFPIDGDKYLEDNGHIGGYNLYGSNLDKIIEKYYSENSSVGKFSLTGGLGFVFNATEELKGATMYKEDGSDNAVPYAIDVNAALLMGTRLVNVRVTGVNKTDKTVFDSPAIANVQFDSDMSGIKFEISSRGVIEFKNDAPSMISVGSKSKVILHKVSHETIVNSANIELKDTVTQAQADNLEDYAVGSHSNVYKSDSINLNNLSASFDSVLAPSENARWERAGNQGKNYGEVE